MIGLIISVTGIIVMLGNRNFTAAALCVIALCVASLCDEGSARRWFLGTAVLVAAIIALFQVSFWIGVVVVFVCALSALTADSSPPEHRIRNF